MTHKKAAVSSKWQEERQRVRERGVGGKGDLLTSERTGDVKDWPRRLGPLDQKSGPQASCHLFLTTGLQESCFVIPQITKHSSYWRQQRNTDGRALPSWNVHSLRENRTVCASEKWIMRQLLEILGATLKNHWEPWLSHRQTGMRW